MPTQITDVSDVILIETTYNGFRHTVVATKLPFNLVVAGGEMDTHYIFNMWLGNSEPYTVVAMWPKYRVDLEYMLRKSDLSWNEVHVVTPALTIMFDIEK